MGCPKNDFNWGAGDPDFLRNLFLGIPLIKMSFPENIVQTFL